MATKRARLTALMSGGAIPDTADYQVRLEPEGTLVGTVNEDFAVESNGGDVFQLGNASWRVLRVEPGIVRVADAKGAPPSLPFWLGEAPGRTRELAAEIGRLRTMRRAARTPPRLPVGTVRRRRLPEAAAVQIAEYVEAGRQALGRRSDAAARRPRALLRRERRHAARRPRAVRLADQPRVGARAAQALLRRASASSSRPPRTRRRSSSRSARSTASRSRRSSTTSTRTPRATCSSRRCSPRRCSRRAGAGTRSASLLLERSRGRQEGAGAAAADARERPARRRRSRRCSPAPRRCPGGPIEVPMDHPIVRQTIEDCLNEAMDVDGFLEVLRGLQRRLDRAASRSTRSSPRRSRAASCARSPTRSSTTRRSRSGARRRSSRGACSTRARPTRSARSTPRRSRACGRRPGRSPRTRGSPRGAALDGLRHGRGGAAVAGRGSTSSRRAAASCWRGRPLVRGRGAARPEGGAARPPGGARARRRGDDPLLARARGRGRRAPHAHRRAARPGATGGCSRASIATRSTGCAARSSPSRRPSSCASSPAGSTPIPSTGSRAARRRARSSRSSPGFEVPAAAWEASVLPARVRGYKREWLDQLTLSGEVAWGRLWGAGATADPAHADLPVARARISTPGSALAAQSVRRRALRARRSRSSRRSPRAERCSSRSSRARRGCRRVVEEGLGS